MITFVYALQSLSRLQLQKWIWGPVGPQTKVQNTDSYGLDLFVSEICV